MHKWAVLFQNITFFPQISVHKKLYYDEFKKTYLVWFFITFTSVVPFNYFLGVFFVFEISGQLGRNVNHIQAKRLEV